MNEPRPFDIFSNAPPDAQRAMIACIEKTRAQLVAGELAGLVLVPVPSAPHISCDVILSGEPGAIVFQLEIARAEIVQLELFERHQRGEQDAAAMAMMLSAKNVGQA